MEIFLENMCVHKFSKQARSVSPYHNHETLVEKINRKKERKKMRKYLIMFSWNGVVTQYICKILNVLSEKC